MVEPKIYVADIAAYNEGMHVGEWVDLTDFDSAEELMQEITDLMAKWSKEQGVEREEWAIHDHEGIPSNLASEYMGEKDFEAIYEMIDKAEETGLPYDVIEEWMSHTGNDSPERIDDAFMGSFDSEDDWVYDWVEEGLVTPSSHDVYVSETDRRIIASEEESRVREDMEYENEHSDEPVHTDEEIEEAGDAIYDEWYKGLEDPYDFLVEEQGMYSEEDIKGLSWVQVDYKKVGQELNWDHTTFEIDGVFYVFSNNYAKGGKVSRGRSRDRKFLSNEKHELDYASRNNRNRKGYGGKKKFKAGGSIKSSDIKDISIGGLREDYGGGYGVFVVMKDGTKHHIRGNNEDLSKVKNAPVQFRGIEKTMTLREYATDKINNGYTPVKKTLAKGGGIGVSSKESTIYSTKVVDSICELTGTNSRDSALKMVYSDKGQGVINLASSKDNPLPPKVTAKIILNSNKVNWDTKKFGYAKGGSIESDIKEEIKKLEKVLANDSIAEKHKDKARKLIKEKKASLKSSTKKKSAPRPKAKTVKAPTKKQSKAVKSPFPKKKFSIGDKVTAPVTKGKIATVRSIDISKNNSWVYTIEWDGHSYEAGYQALTKASPKAKSVKAPVKKKAKLVKKPSKTVKSPAPPSKTSKSTDGRSLIADIAKQIRKVDETYMEARSRAAKIWRGELDMPKGVTIKRSLVQNGKTNKKKDKQRKALHAGKRTSKSGRVYYENRANRSDVDRRTKL